MEEPGFEMWWDSTDMVFKSKFYPKKVRTGIFS